MFSRTVRILNKTGFHARPAALFAETAGSFSSGISVVKGDQQVDAKGVLGLMLLEATRGTEITIRAEGKDEVAAVNALAELVQRDLDNEDTDAFSPARQSSGME